MLRTTGSQVCQKALFHSSAVDFAAARSLTKSLKPTTKTGQYAVASKPSFSRDDAPHRGLKPKALESRSRTPRLSQIDFPQRERPKQFGSAESSRRPTTTTTTSTRPVEQPSVDEHLKSSDEFFRPAQSVSVAADTKGKSKALPVDSTLPTQFTSPTLLPGFVQSLKETLGQNVRPTPIQSLAIQWLLANPPDTPGWKQFLLAAETGSGKSIAYLLPMLQAIKEAEVAEKDVLDGERPSTHSNRLHNPRGLILAPTHELARQLSGFAKDLLHQTKLRVMCASQANVKSTQKVKDKTSRKMAGMFDEGAQGEGEFQVSKGGHSVDLLVGTPMKVLEMVRGRGWDRVHSKEDNDGNEVVLEKEEEETRRSRRGRDFEAGWATKWSTPELGLKNIEWVVVDEADVLFDPDFQETTRLLLADISAARGHPVPVISASELEAQQSGTSDVSTPTPIEYPFNLVLTSATIPNSLNQYLENYHPSLVRLASPQLHHLPKTLQTEYVAWTGGNKFADILRRVNKIWAEDSAASKASTGKEGKLSKVLIFCNKSNKVVELCSYLEEQGIKSVAMTSKSEHRGRGSNRHLTGFLRQHQASQAGRTIISDVKTDPHVMVTTSLLSRGLDFTPDIKHVFIVDEPRNMVDFLHRAGRSGRAGQRGKVVIFGKLKGRGSERGRDVRRRVGALV
ncbi:P-loop containing nucleoside triphosphate hydrolase protein, partial [Crepidotus variabilis]